MKEMLKNNYKLKIFSVAMAFFVWLFVMAEVDPIITRTIDNVQITSISNQSDIDALNLVVSPNSKITTQVVVKGRRSSVNNYISSGAVISGAIVEPKLGENKVELTIQRSDNVEVSISPINSKIELEEISSIRKVITTKLVGDTGDNYEIYNVTVNPSSTLVEGPKSLVDNVIEVAATIDIEGANKDFVNNVKLEALDSEGNIIDGVKLQISYVEATVVVHKIKTVPIKLVVLDGTDLLTLDNYYIEPNEIKIKGLETDIDKINEIKTVPILLEQLNNVDNMQVNLEIPEGIRSTIYSVRLNSDNTGGIIKNLEFKDSDVLIEGFEENEIDSIFKVLPDQIKVSLSYSKGLEHLLEDLEVEIYIDSEKSNIDENKLYFAVKSNVPYLNATITPSVINRMG